MNNSPIDFLAIGDTVIDAFIQLKEAKIITDPDGTRELAVRYGDKVPFESVEVLYGVGNSANAAVSATRLGLSSALVTDVGEDRNGRESVLAVMKNGTNVDYVTAHEGIGTNYHYVLRYEADRTILVKHEEYPYKMPQIDRELAWVYLSSVGHNSLEYHGQIVEFLNAHPESKLIFQPGTYQMRFGLEKMKDIYARTDIFACNVEEAKRILEVDAELPELLDKMHALGPKIVLITDGPAGAYASDGKGKWFMPPYPDPAPPVERTGAGDAFTSTFSAAIALGKSTEEALMWAPINPMSVVQYIGAQAGLLTRQKLEEYIANAPADYKPRPL